MIHASFYQPNIFPVGKGTPSSMARVQAIDPTANTNFQRVKEIGRLLTVGYVRKIPTIAYRMTQLEYGSFNFWQQITNKASDVTTLTLEDFRTSAFDIAAFLTDDNYEYRGVQLYPYMRCSSFALNLGNPDATVERTFNFVGEKAITFEAPYGAGAIQPYYTEVEKTAGSGHDNHIDLSAHTPVIDPDVPGSYSNAEKYIFRVSLTRNITAYDPNTNTSSTKAVTTVLSPVTTALNPALGVPDYTYDPATKMVTIAAPVAADVYKVFFITAVRPAEGTFVADDSDAAAINATSTDIFLFVPASGVPNSSDYLYRIQSCSIDVTFERSDLKEIGNKNVVQLGINLNKVNVKIGRILEKFTIDEVLRGVVPGYGKLDISKYGYNLSLIVKVYSDDTKTDFLYGMQADKLAPMDIGQGVPVNNYVKDNCTLDGESLTISTDNADLGNFEGPVPQLN